MTEDNQTLPAVNHGAGTWQGVDANGFRVMNGVHPSGDLFFAHDDTADMSAWTR